MASNLGIIAKNAEGNSLNAYITDLKTTDPLSGVSVEIFDYQNQLIGVANTDDNGMVERNRKTSLGFSVELTVFRINESLSIFFIRTVTVSFVEK